MYSFSAKIKGVPMPANTSTPILPQKSVLSTWAVRVLSSSSGKTGGAKNCLTEFIIISTPFYSPNAASLAWFSLGRASVSTSRSAAMLVLCFSAVNQGYHRKAGKSMGIGWLGALHLLCPGNARLPPNDACVKLAASSLTAGDGELGEQLWVSGDRSPAAALAGW